MLIAAPIHRVNIYMLCTGMLGSRLFHVIRRGLVMDNSAKKRLVWVDLEMTGLDVNKDHILEMACLVTDGDLNIVAEGPNIVIHQSDQVLKGMNEWCVNQHGKSGLTDAVRKSEISLTEAEYKMLSFIRQHIPRNCCPLAGNSVHADKSFLDKYMPQFMEHLHYRIVDVSSVKELCKRWYPALICPAKKESHRAIDDIIESIEELKFYRKHVFRSPSNIG